MWKKIIVLVFIFVSFIFLYYLMYKNLSIRTVKVLEENSLLSQKNELLKNAWFETLLSSDVDINKDLSFVSDSGYIYFRDIVYDKTLIVRLSYAACQPCLERELDNLHKFEEKNIPVIIIASYPNKFALDVLLKKHNISSRAYLLSANQRVFPFDENRALLYMFIIDKNLTVQKFFMPVQMVDDVSDAYFKYIESVFVDDKVTVRPT